MRIATWNVNSVVARLPRCSTGWAGPNRTSLCLQELKTSAEQLPRGEIAALGYEAAVYGTGRWNGVAILSRVGLADVRRGLVDEPGFVPEDAMLEAHEPRASAPPAAGCGCGRCTCRTAARSGTRTTTTSWSGSTRCAPPSRAELPDAPRYAVLGDFNIAPTDADVWDPAAFAAART